MPAASPDPISAPLERLEALLRTLVRSNVEFITLIGDDLLDAGGKRSRPAVTLLAAQACRTVAGHPNNLPQAVNFAAAIELLHSATLLHDDLVDDADTRRGHEAAFRHYGNAVSVLSGDFLLSRVLALLAELPSAFTALIAQTSAAICEGEVLQFQVAALQTYSRANYERIIDGKTAALVAAAARGGAMLASAPEAVVEALSAFGLHYGRAFQMRDDWLDLTASAATLGKPEGGDLREGKATLPTLLLMDTPAREEVETILGRRGSQPEDLNRLRALLAGHDIARAARAEVQAETAQAVSALDALPPSPERQVLAALAEQNAERSA
ncbi:MAG TPA: polyprenyl synthetase family protein [Deinococcales bacterium]|nr:polyprenyl synthetase family protein [Deinococcales bacterium]